VAANRMEGLRRGLTPMPDRATLAALNQEMSKAEIAVKYSREAGTIDHWFVIHKLKAWRRCVDCRVLKTPKGFKYTNTKVCLKCAPPPSPYKKPPKIHPSDTVSPAQTRLLRMHW